MYSYSFQVVDLNEMKKKSYQVHLNEKEYPYQVLSPFQKVPLD